MKTKTIGLLLGNEIAWPDCFEGILRRLDRPFEHEGESYRFELERIMIEPFAIDYEPKYDVVVDRLAHWYVNVREWLKKVAIRGEVYLLNNPFNFQAMEKHTAFCAMDRLGMDIPETWLIPQKEYPGDDARSTYTVEHYNKLFDLREIGARIGYPLYMKPFDGGGWRGVSRIENHPQLVEEYNRSRQMNMHLQKGIDDFEVFVRCVGVGPQCLLFRYDPDKPLHERYQVDHDFLSAEDSFKIMSITRTINSFFRWEFNSCECIFKEDRIYPIDFANACPDSSLISLHYYFPILVKAIIRWVVFCGVSERRMKLDMETSRYFQIADGDRSFDDKLQAYSEIASDYYDENRFQEFCDREMADLDEVALEFFQTSEFQEILEKRVAVAFPAHEHKEFIDHYRGLIDLWVRTEKERLSNPYQ